MSGASAAAGSATRPTGASVLADVSVPLPRGFLPVPRPFDAQSDDWQELPDDTTLAGVRPTPGRTMLTARHTPVASTPVTEEDRHPDVPRVKGALLAVAVDYLRDSYGPSGLDRILGRIRPESAYRLRGVLMPVAWMPAHLLGDLANAAESSVGDGGGDVAIEMGRSAALRSLSTSHRHFTQSVAPTQAILRIPKIWRTFHNGGDVVIIRAPTGAWQVQVSGHVPQTLVHAQVMMGFYLGLLELTGAHDVRADVIAFGELGLGRTVTELHL